MGPNASGKSNLGVALATRFDGEVISADSRQVFSKLDLGTGKLAQHERQGIPHHLVDIAEPGTDFSLARFQHLAYAAIDNVIGRGRMPILVGGTGLYVRAVLEGFVLVDVPKNPKRRKELETLRMESLVERLGELDELAFRRVDLNNRRRLIRAIEVAEAGVPFEATRCRSPHYLPLKLGLTWPDSVLRKRIQVRLSQRIEEGMIEEVFALLEGGVDRDWLHRLGLEYRHVLWFLDGKYSSVSDLEKGLSAAIWQFSRRQLTWFRKERDLVWLSGEDSYDQEAVKRTEAFLTAT
jgi:tRNA dimethylallyltransferase